MHEAAASIVLTEFRAPPSAVEVLVVEVLVPPARAVAAEPLRTVVGDAAMGGSLQCGSALTLLIYGTGCGRGAWRHETRSILSPRAYPMPPRVQLLGAAHTYGKKQLKSPPVPPGFRTLQMAAGDLI